MGGAGSATMGGAGSATGGGSGSARVVSGGGAAGAGCGGAALGGSLSKRAGGAGAGRGRGATGLSIRGKSRARGGGPAATTTGGSTAMGGAWSSPTTRPASVAAPRAPPARPHARRRRRSPKSSMGALRHGAASCRSRRRVGGGAMEGGQCTPSPAAAPQPDVALKIKPWSAWPGPPSPPPTPRHKFAGVTPKGDRHGRARLSGRLPDWVDRTEKRRPPARIWWPSSSDRGSVTKSVARLLAHDS